MRTFKNYAFTAFGLIGLLFSSCDQKVTVQSKVNSDGSLERIVILAEVDSSFVQNNFFGLNQGNGWNFNIRSSEKQNDPKGKRVNRNRIITFKKKFNSVSEANNEMNTGSDSLFHIRSNFEKKFRWFYTYLSYSDTYASINRFKELSKEQFFTQEDIHFMKRMPAAGKSITKADSFFLEQLNNKISDQYLPRAIYEEHFALLISSAQENQIEKSWIGSLNQRKEEIFRRMMAIKNDDFLDKPFLTKLIDSLDIGLPVNKVDSSYKMKYKELESRLKFMFSVVSMNEFNHLIEIPGSIISTNADSVNRNILTWKPLPLKFMLDDYTMYAESRSPNYWAFALSGLVLALTLVAFVRRKKVNPRTTNDL